MALELQEYTAINTGVIDEESFDLGSDNITSSKSFVDLTDTVGSLPSSGVYFAEISNSTFGFVAPQAKHVGADSTAMSASGSDVQAVLESLDSNIQTLDGQLTPDADPTTTSTVEEAGALMDSDFGSNGIMRRTGSGAYDTIDNGIDQLTSSEASQLQNIDSVTISNDQWGIVGGLDQSLATSSDVTFSTINDLSLAEQSTAFTIEGGSDTTRTLTMDADLTASDVMSGLSDDPDPELGGDLKLNGNNQFLDANGNTVLAFSYPGNAVNFLDLHNASTGNDVVLQMDGTGSNIGVNIETKGDGQFHLNGTGITQSTWDNVAEIDQDLSMDGTPTFADVTADNGVFYNQTGENVQIKTLPVPDSTEVQITDIDATTKMVVMIIDKTGSDQFAMFYLDGSNNSVTEIHALTANWGTSSGSQTQNIYHDGTNYVLENTSGGVKEYAVQIFAVD